MRPGALRGYVPGPAKRGPMLQTSIIVELLRSQPRLTFWLAALAQTALWWVFPSLFFSSPPGDLPIVLAVGHEFQLGSYFGPPLAFWLADIAFVIGGTVAVYLLAQACVLVTYWAVFELGRAIGLPVANSEVMRFKDEIAIVIERYDRVHAGNVWQRIHQEDPDSSIARETGGYSFLARLLPIDKFESGADRQRRIYRESGNWKAVIDDLTQRAAPEVRSTIGPAQIRDTPVVRSK